MGLKRILYHAEIIAAFCEKQILTASDWIWVTQSGPCLDPQECYLEQLKLVGGWATPLKNMSQLG